MEGWTLRSFELLRSFFKGLVQEPIAELSVLIAFTVTYLFLLRGLRLFSESLRKPLAFRFLRLFLALSFYALATVGIERYSELLSLHIIIAGFYVEALISLVSLLEMWIKPGTLYLVLTRVFLFMGGISLFLQDLSRRYDPALGSFYSIGFKLFSALFLTVLLIETFSRVAEELRDRVIGRVLGRARLGFLILYIFIITAWVLGEVSLSRDFVIRVVLITGILFGYYSLQVYLISHLERSFPDSFSAIKDSLRKFLTLLALFILYKGMEILFPLEKAKSYLGRAYVINTELVKISLLSLVESLFIFFFFLSLTALLKNIAYMYYMKKGKEVEAGSIRALISNTGLLLTATLSLVHLGITWKVMIPIAGAVGVGLGFGLQTIFNNYVSGFILLLSKNIKVGDLVEIEGNAGRAIGSTSETIFGQVANINILTTVIRTTDNVEIAIPNSEFVSGRIINYSLSDPYIRVRIPFGVSYSSDPKKVRDILLRVAQESDIILKEPKPKVWFYEMGDSALIFYLLVWVDVRKFYRMRALRSEIYFRAWEELKKEGIEIPFPQRDLWFKNPLKVEIDERGLHERGSKGGKESSS